MAFSYLQHRQYRFHKIDYWLTLSLFFTLVGLLTSHLIPKNAYYLSINSIVYFVEIQLQIMIVRHFFYSKNNILSEEIIKVIMVFTIGIAFIYLIFPLMDFWDQIIVFSRILQFSFLFAYIFKNRKLHYQIDISFWTILISNILSVVVLYVQVPYYYQLFANFLFFTSKIAFVNGLILSTKETNHLKPKVD